VIGDAVNLASRLEGVTKQFHTDLCIGESVHHWLQGEFLTRTLALLIVKGKTKPVRVYEVLDDLKGLEPMDYWSHDWARRYERGFEAYLARDFQQASELFGECLKEKPDDFLSGEYLKEAQEFLVHPPEPSWGGVIKLDSK
jgi:adenylate cyclase